MPSVYPDIWGRARDEMKKSGIGCRHRRRGKVPRMTTEEALRTLTGTRLKQANLPEAEEAVAVLVRFLEDIPAHTIQFIESHHRFNELEARLNSLESAYKDDKCDESDREPVTGS
jgi:hypothetical protein